MPRIRPGPHSCRSNSRITTAKHSEKTQADSKSRHLIMVMMELEMVARLTWQTNMHVLIMMLLYMTHHEHVPEDTHPTSSQLFLVQTVTYNQRSAKLQIMYTAISAHFNKQFGSNRCRKRIK